MLQCPFVINYCRLQTLPPDAQLALAAALGGNGHLEFVLRGIFLQLFAT